MCLLQNSHSHLYCTVKSGPPSHYSIIVLYFYILVFLFSKPRHPVKRILYLYSSKTPKWDGRSKVRWSGQSAIVDAKVRWFGDVTDSKVPWSHQCAMIPLIYIISWKTTPKYDGLTRQSPMVQRLWRHVIMTLFVTFYRNLPNRYRRQFASIKVVMR
jgi:hypothetical protein